MCLRIYLFCIAATMTIVTDFSVALKILYNSQVFPWCFWKPVKCVSHKTPMDISGSRPSPLYLIPGFWIQLQLKEQQEESVFLYWFHSYPGPDQRPQSEQIPLTLLFVRGIYKNELLNNNTRLFPQHICHELLSQGYRFSLIPFMTSLCPPCWLWVALYLWNKTHNVDLFAAQLRAAQIQSRGSSPSRCISTCGVRTTAGPWGTKQLFLKEW